MLIEVSSDTETILLPVELYLTHHTLSLCSFSVFIQQRWAMSHTLTVLSALPETKFLQSGEKSTLSTHDP